MVAHRRHYCHSRCTGTAWPSRGGRRNTPGKYNNSSCVHKPTERMAWNTPLYHVQIVAHCLHAPATRPLHRPGLLAISQMTSISNPQVRLLCPVCDDPRPMLSRDSSIIPTTHTTIFDFVEDSRRICRIVCVQERSQTVGYQQSPCITFTLCTVYLWHSSPWHFPASQFPKSRSANFALYDTSDMKLGCFMTEARELFDVCEINRVWWRAYITPTRP